MKLLKKINKGLVLTVLVLAILITYLIFLESSRNNEKLIIDTACANFIDIVDKYSLLPQKYATVNKSIPDDELKLYFKQMHEELSKYTLNKEVENNLCKMIENKLQTELLSTFVTTNYDRKILKVNKYIFDDKQVTVNLTCLLNTEVKSLLNKEFDVLTKKYIGEETIDKKSSKVNATITLKKVNNEFKIVSMVMFENLNKGGVSFE
ncbi:MAG: hypothetical protein RSB76_00515 [Clostridia bacterium]